MREIVSEKEFLHVMHDELARLGLTGKKSFVFRNAFFVLKNIEKE
jgi:hypothetical protein